MPIGITCAGATLTRLTRMVLQRAEEYANAYIGDIVIRNNSFREHYDHLRDVLEAPGTHQG